MTGHVYFALIGGFLKVGHSTSYGYRIAQHRHRYGKHRVKFLCAVPGTRDDEQWLHSQLQQYRLPRRSFGGPEPEIFRIEAAPLIDREYPGINLVAAIEAVRAGS